MAKKIKANVAQTCAINLAVIPLGQSTLTAAWKSTAQTSHKVRKKENRPCGCCTCKKTPYN